MQTFEPAQHKTIIQMQNIQIQLDLNNYQQHCQLTAKSVRQ